MQLGLSLRERFGWGGARVGAGRPARKGAAVRHRERPVLSKNHPVHVTVRLVRAVGNARKKKSFFAIRKAFEKGCERFGFRLLHYSVQRDHIHLIVEAEDRSALSRALKGLQVRIARALNRLIGRSGRVFSDRYHEHVLKTPREVRNAISYVLLNSRRHAFKDGIELTNTLLDPCASGLAFDGWTTSVVCIIDDPPPVSTPRTWLMRIGWRRRGLVSPAEIPAS